jgi:hypothetical protein
MANLEAARQQYLIELAVIIKEEKLSPVEATGLMFGEIASWLMTISGQLAEENVMVCPKCATLFHRDY